MKAINVTELKSHLSKYLRLASRGVHITVKDRDEPIAELGPPRAPSLSRPDRMAREGRLQLGTQHWETLEISKLNRRVDIQSALRDVRDSNSPDHES